MMIASVWHRLDHVIECYCRIACWTGSSQSLTEHTVMYLCFLGYRQIDSQESIAVRYAARPKREAELPPAL